MTATDTPTVLIVDDSPLSRTMVRKALEAEGYHTLSATDGFDGLKQLGAHPVNAIILDNEMPRMDGLGFLRALRAEPRWKHLPVLMLTTTVARDIILKASHYGLSGYLLKSRLSLPDMLVRIEKALASPKPVKANQPQTVDSLIIPNLITRDATLAAIAAINESRTLPGIVAQIVNATNSPTANVAEIAGIIKQDPLLAIRLVQLASSAKFGGAKIRLGSVEDAVRVVGVSQVNELALTFSVFKTFSPGRADGIDLLRCWQHAMAVAAITGRITPKSDELPAGLPYLVGLCHDLAEIFLRQRFPQEFAAAVDFGRQVMLPPVRLTQQIFGIAYPELVEALVDKMLLPPAFSQPIKDFTFAADETPDAHASLLARSLSIANALAHSMQCCASADCAVTLVQQSDCRTALISPHSANLAEIRSESLMSTAALANCNAQQAAELMKPLLPKQDLRVWYVRHGLFMPCDPVEEALKNLCTVETHDRLPQPEELVAIQAVIVGPTNPQEPLRDPRRFQTRDGQAIPTMYLVRSGENDHGASNALICRYPIANRRIAEFLSKKENG